MAGKGHLQGNVDNSGPALLFLNLTHIISAQLNSKLIKISHQSCIAVAIMLNVNIVFNVQ